MSLASPAVIGLIRNRRTTRTYVPGDDYSARKYCTAGIGRKPSRS
jgi:hypothetical protein